MGQSLPETYALKDSAGREYKSKYSGSGKADRWYDEELLKDRVNNQNKILDEGNQILNDKDNGNFFRKKYWDPSAKDDDKAVEIRDTPNNPYTYTGYNYNDNKEAIQNYKNLQIGLNKYLETNPIAKKTAEFYKSRGYSGDELFNKLRYQMSGKGSTNLDLETRTGDKEYTDFYDQEKAKRDNVKLLTDQGVTYQNLSRDQQKAWIESITDIPALDTRPPVMVVNNPANPNIQLNNQQK